MHDTAASPLLAPLRPEERYASWQLALGDGSLVGGGTGIVALLRSMELTRPTERVFAAVPDGVLETLYGFVAGHRSHLGRLVPDGPAPRRFP